MLHPGEQVHHYVVQERVGGGGMAVVYRVRHAILGHDLALKVLDPYWVRQPHVRHRFLAEGRIMALVRHPAIVMVTDAVVDAPRGIAGLVMEYVEGPTLQQLVTRMQDPPDIGLVHAVMLPILDGMHHVHQEGVVHRDLKPGNVLLSRDAAGHWYPRVVDFGIAHVAEEARITTRTRPTGGGRMGTPAFMCPEQVDGGRPDPRWDVFALGTMLYELATGGVHPFEKGDEEATLEAVHQCRPTPIAEIDPDIDPRIVQAIDGALARVPEDRFPDCATFAAVLRAELPAPPRRSTPIPSVVPEVQEVDHTVADPPRAALVLGDRPSTRQRFALGARATVGSAADCDVVLPKAGGVEPLHCIVDHQDGMWLLEDASATGTRVNGARVRRVQLAPDDLVRLGHTVLHFEAEAEAPGVAPSVQPAGHWLEIHTRDGGTERLPVEPGGIVLGRDPSCDVVIDDPQLSRRHCRFALQGIDVIVEDLNSASGTEVDGSRATFRRLRGQEVVRIGVTKVVYHRSR